jgi:hypothetical protein
MSAKLASHIMAWAVVEGDVRIPERVEEACTLDQVEVEEGIGSRGNRDSVKEGRVVEGSRSGQVVVGFGKGNVVVEQIRGKVPGDGLKWVPSAEALHLVED